MPFQTPITIKRALDQIHRHDFVLPAIQREFVWKPEQIARLFDSLMRSYPIGSFLFWEVDRTNVRQYKFYDFVLNYHQRNAPHCPPLDMPPDTAVTAVLDGQQRLTALNIGLRGSHATKIPRKRYNNSLAYPTKRLHLNLLADAGENNAGMHYDFRFLTEKQAEVRDETHAWFCVSDILDLTSGSSLFKYVRENDLADRDEPYETLDRLYEVVHREPIIAYYDEQSQDLDKVLNIFIRTNSGGTELSYSDLLLSIATAQWDERDARKEINDLVDNLNSIRSGFSFTKDFVLKAGLMLTDITSIRFMVTNFNRDNMMRLQDDWPHIAHSLHEAVELVADFGYSGSTLGSINAVLPIAYYLHKREVPSNYRTSDHHDQDREAIRTWLTRSLLKTGVWGAGADSLLTALRTSLSEDGQDRFPTTELEATLSRRGKSLRFHLEEIEDLADIKYGDKRTFALLSLLYDFVDLRNEFHVDHVMPKSHFTDAKLLKAGVAPQELWRYQDHVDRLGNLQLLDGTANRSKNARMPQEWLQSHIADPTAQRAYLDRHDLGTLPEDMSGFESFYDMRHERLLARLCDVLGVDPDDLPPTEPESTPDFSEEQFIRPFSGAEVTDDGQDEVSSDPTVTTNNLGQIDP